MTETTAQPADVRAALTAVSGLMEQHELRTGYSVTESAGRAMASRVVIGGDFEGRFASLWEAEGPDTANAWSADNMRLLNCVIGLLYPVPSDLTEER